MATADSIGDTLLLFVRTMAALGTAFKHPRRVAEQMLRVGWESFPIVALMAVFTGMIIGLYSGDALKGFGGEHFLASIVSLAILKELAPILTGLLLSGRIGAAFAAEIGTMQVNEEIDALHTLGINPVSYLTVPRFVASIIMLPVLVMYADLLGMVGGGIVASAYFDMSPHAYIREVSSYVDYQDILEGLIKAFIYGGIISIISSQKGFNTRGGAEGVGKSITSCVVSCFVWIFIANYLVTFTIAS